MATSVAEIVETGNKRDGKGRQISTAQRRAEVVREYRGSGLTMAAFARREGINYATFAGWVLKSERQAARSPLRFAEVRLPLATMADRRAALEVRLPDGTVASGSNPTELAALVRALRG